MKELIDRLIVAEGKRKSAYQDSLGYWTIGIGRLIDKRLNAGLSEDEMLYLLNNDIAQARAELETFSWFTRLDPVREEVLIELHFSMGLEHLLEFHSMLNFIEQGYYLNAATQLMKSLWARQVGQHRAKDLANRLATGKYDYDGEKAF
jgi:lysozyme